MVAILTLPQCACMISTRLNKYVSNAQWFSWTRRVNKFPFEITYDVVFSIWVCESHVLFVQTFMCNLVLEMRYMRACVLYGSDNVILDN